VKDLLNVLNGARGSSTKYQLVVRELLILDRTLLEVDIFCRTHEGTPELNALCVTARQAAESCRKLIDEFTRKINKYRPSLAERSSSTAATKAAMKIRWEVCMEDDVARFRADISAQAQSMKMLLAFASMCARSRLMFGNAMADSPNSQKTPQSDQLQARCSTFRRRTKDDRVGEANRYRPARGQEQVRGDEHADIGRERIGRQDCRRAAVSMVERSRMDVKRSMLGIFSMDLAIYGVVIAIQKAIPSGPLFEEPFWLEDAMGRVSSSSTVHWILGSSSCSSRDSFSRHARRKEDYRQRIYSSRSRNWRRYRSDETVGRIIPSRAKGGYEHPFPADTKRQPEGQPRILSEMPAQSRKDLRQGSPMVRWLPELHYF